MDSHNALVSVKLLDQHRVLKELVGSAFNMEDYKDATVGEGFRRADLENQCKKR